MSEPVSRSEFEALLDSMRALEQRVTRLEGEVRVAEREPANERVPAMEVQLSASGEATMTPPGMTAGSTNAAPILGKALLGLAGAYLLRALTELGTIPMGPGVALGMVYAMGWLGLAARGAAGRRLEAMMYSLTSVLILTPLLWEAVVRFHAVPRPLAAVSLVIFTVLGLTISWRKNLAHIAWVATLAGVLTSAGLLIATHDLVPFTLGLLAIAAAVECSACFEHWLHERWVVAVVADLAVLILTDVSTRSGGLPESYVPIRPGWVICAQLLLLSIYLASAMTRTLWRGLPFRNLEVFQCFVAFALAVGGGLRITQSAPAMTAALASICLLFGGASYLVSTSFLEGLGHRGRNFYLYSSFGFLLTIVGAGILLSPALLGAVSALFALVFFVLAARWNRLTLRWHGTLYLAFAAILSGALGAAFSIVVGGAGLASLSVSAWIGAASALVACLHFHRAAPAETAWARAAAFVIAAISAVTSIGIVAGACTAALGLDPAYSATLRTAVILGAAIFLAWTGQRSGRAELSWTVYLLMALAGYKFLVADFARQHTLSLVVSLAMFGGAMLLLPRFFQKAPGDVAPS